MRAKASVKLTVPNGPRVNVGSGGTENHAKLKNLGFEESGHIGFQKELTPAEREAIASVAGKEDKANKIQSINELQNDEQYLSAGGTLSLANTAEDNAKAHADGLYNELKENLEACGDFEPIDSGTLTEDVVQISPTINGQYKELYIFFKMPPQADVATNTSKARMSMWNGNTMIYDQGNAFVDNYNMNWYIVCTVKMYGTRCYSQMWYAKYREQASGLIIPYVVPSSDQNYAGAVCPHMRLNNPYLDTIAVKMSAQSRAFPKGTTYELWGVKA